MLVLEGCVQRSAAPQIDAAASRVLDRLGISLTRVAAAGCCGAIEYHLNAQEAGRDRMRALIDAWWPHIEAGAEAILSTASGCGSMLKDYAHVLAHDPAYRAKAEKLSELARDMSEIVLANRERLSASARSAPGRRIAFHSPCSLQHGLRIRDAVETILLELGFHLAHVPDAHLCCGSAGTYSILQPELATRLREAKQTALQSEAPDEIVTANIGCLLHLRAGMPTPIRHWIELVDESLRNSEE
jgi:glycolate oxidase iron-sulfur subunit